MPRKKAAKFRCKKCGQAFGMAMHLGRHMTTKHGQSPKKTAGRARVRKQGNAGLGEQLGSIIDGLQAERQEHLEAVAKIDAIFAECGIQPAAPKHKGGRPAKAKAAAKPAGRRAPRGRRKFATTGNDSILALVKKAGAKGVMGAEIAKHWKAEGRGAGVYVNLSQLAKAKKLKREKVKGEKGSRYRTE